MNENSFLLFMYRTTGNTPNTNGHMIEFDYLNQCKRTHQATLDIQYDLRRKRVEAQHPYVCSRPWNSGDGRTERVAEDRGGGCLRGDFKA
jgi:hypothetical protein